MKIIFKLKPCPFCNGAAEIHELTSCTPPFLTAYIIACKKCGASSDYYDNAEEAIGTWNSRT